MLAQATGTFRRWPISGPLADHFVFAWSHTLPAGRIMPIIVAPDGCIDLQWIDGDWRVAGPDSEAHAETLPAGATVVGFRFQPAAATAWLDAPASALLDMRPSLSDLWGANARDLCDAGERARERLTGNLDARVDALIDALEKAAAQRDLSSAAGDADMRAAYAYVAKGAPSGQHLVPWLAGKLDTSERTLRRRFDETIGYGPMTLARILRFQRFLKLAGDARGASAALLAAEAGYADQAHLSRESRRMAAATPRVIADLLSG